MGLIEKYGTGIKRVRSMFIDYDLLQPKFELIPGGFAVTVLAKKENIITIINDPVNDPVSDPVNDRQKAIIQLIYYDKYINKELIADKLKISVETIKRDIRKLKTLNKIARIGSDKTGYWEIISE